MADEHEQDAGDGQDAGNDHEAGGGQSSADGEKNGGGGGSGKDGADQSADKKSEDGETEEHKQNRKKASPVVKVGLSIFLLVLALGGGSYWFLTRNEIDTDDAYTSGRIVTIAPHVSGYVTELDVNDNEYVHRGQVLARIDPRDYQAAVDQAQASVDQARGQLESAKFTVLVSRQSFPGQLKQAQGQLALAQAQQFRAETDARRQHSVARAATSQQDIDYADAALRQAQAQVLQAQGGLQQASPVGPQISTSQSRVQQQQGTLEQAEAQLRTAQLNLEWAVIRAPHDGWISQRNVERGRYVQSGQSLFSVVMPQIWISANFKETQITRLRPGQPVDISIDAYPGMHLSGHIGSVQHGTGAAFSTFPPENATGNFVKIVQRVPVKIIIDDGLDPTLPIPIGASVEPTVHVE